MALNTQLVTKLQLRLIFEAGLFWPRQQTILLTIYTTAVKIIGFLLAKEFFRACHS